MATSVHFSVLVCFVKWLSAHDVPIAGWLWDFTIFVSRKEHESCSRVLGLQRPGVKVRFRCGLPN